MDLGPQHPIVVHFAIALVVAGVLFRLAWLLGRFVLGGRLAFTGPAACLLLLAGTLATYVAVESGESASGPVDDIPGTHEAVEEHEDWAEWTFRLFVVVSILEAAALVLKPFDKAAPALAASGLLGLVGLYFVFETGEHGGQVVYSHAGGVGTRTGNPRDVERLLLAGLYNQSRVDRGAGRSQDSARLIELAASRWPQDLEVQLLLAESQLLDGKDAALATTTLSRLQIPKEERRLRLRHGILLADALAASGHADAALAALQGMKAQFPDDGAVKERMRKLAAAAASPSAAVPPLSLAPLSSPSPSPEVGVPSPSPSPTSAGS
jgi:uncharacterized membrane protein